MRISNSFLPPLPLSNNNDSDSEGSDGDGGDSFHILLSLEAVALLSLRAGVW